MSANGRSGEHREPQPMREVLRRFMKRSGLGRQVRQPKLFGAWSRAVPAELRAKVRPVALRNRRLTVEVASAALLQELVQFGKEPLLQALTRELRGQYIADIRFVLGHFGSEDEHDDKL